MANSDPASSHSSISDCLNKLTSHPAPTPDAALKAQLQQAILLAEVTNEIRQSLDTHKIFQVAVNKVQNLLNADRVAIFQLHPNAGDTDGVFVAEQGLSIFPSAMAVQVEDDGFSHHYADPSQVGGVIAISDIYTEALSTDHIQILERFQIRAHLVLPLLQGDKLWGQLCIHQCSGPRVWQGAEIEFMQKLADQLSVALKQAELHEQALEKSQQLQIALNQVEAQKARETWLAQYERNISQIIQRIRQSLDIEDIFRATTHDVRLSLGCDRVAVYQFFPDWSGEFLVESTAPNLIPLSESNVSPVWQDTYLQDTQGGKYRNNATTVVTDIYQQSYAACHLAVLERYQIRGYMVVPVFIGETLWGLLAAYQLHQARQWHKVELYLLKQAGAQLGVALQQAELLNQLRDSKNKAETANQAKSAFLANMSHELRTPLNAILGFSQLLNRDENLTPKQKQTLSTINRSGSHLLHLINDVLEMSKIEAGRVSLNLKTCDLLYLLDSLQEMFTLKTESKGLTLIVEKAQNLPLYIRTDESRLRQVLINVLGNAIKFTETGTVTLRVNTRPYQAPTTSLSMESESEKYQPNICLRFDIEDTGVGIAEHEMDTIFDSFTQTSSGRQSFEGTGLGLAICNHFVDLMQGEIQILSQEGQGTTVHIQVPVLATQMKVADEATAQVIIGLAPNQPRYRILIVEDNFDNRQVLIELMTTVGFEVRAVENGQEAIACWQAWQPHLIWMDWHMPVMNGYQATKSIRHIEEAQALHQHEVATVGPSTVNTVDSSDPKTYIIALTASVFENTQNECYEAGCDDFLCKPFQEMMLFEVLAKHLKIEYLYDDYTLVSGSLPAPSSPPMGGEGIEQEMSHFSEAWLTQLQTAAIELDEDQVSQLLVDIAAQHPSLKKELVILFRALQFDKIANFAHQALRLKHQDSLTRL